MTDPRCEAPPAGPDTGADATPSQLDPGDTWTYTCTAQTTGQPAGTFVNTANVTATDFNGRDGDGHGRLPDGARGRRPVLPERDRHGHGAAVAARAAASRPFNGDGPARGSRR